MDIFIVQVNINRRSFIYKTIIFSLHIKINYKSNEIYVSRQWQIKEIDRKCVLNTPYVR